MSDNKSKRYSAVNISAAGVRNSLNPRREPYWAMQLAAGRFIGFRRIDSKRGSWIARARDSETGKQQYHALGDLTDTFDYPEVKKAAETWFAELDAGIVNDGPFTVADACKEYVDELRSAKRTAAADDAKWRFKRGAIYGHEDDAELTELAKLRIGRIEVKKLRPTTIKQWRELLGVENAGANRMMTTLRAALNLAVENDRVAATAARAWRSVKQHEKADGRRDLFLDKAQRNALLAAATGAVRDLIEAAIHTGGRPGELIALKRSDFEAEDETLTLTGKTGTRTVPLSAPAVAFFNRMAKDKLPNAPLLADDSGAPWTYTRRAVYAREIRAAATAAELPPKVVLYSLRHSWITEALRGGMATLDVCRLTGTSLQMIEKHYGKFVQDAARERLAKVAML